MSLEGKTAQEIEALATLADSIANNPRTRMPFQRLLKAANPGISVPEVDMEERVAAAVKPHVEKIEKLEARDAQLEAQTAGNVLYENLRDDGVVKNRATFGELVKYASEQGFQTTDSGLRMAARHRSAEQESAEPTPYTAGGFDLSDTKTNGDLMKNPNAWARDTASRVLDEIAKGRNKATR